jgi:hypothetical protein
LQCGLPNCSQLPNENWYDLLAFVPRRQLGNNASQIGDRQFAHILQSYLHDEVDNKVTLGQMLIIPPRRNVTSDRPMMQYSYECAAVDLPDCPMPKNVKNFIEIYLKFVLLSIIKLARLFWNYINTFVKKFQLIDLIISRDCKF